MNLTFKQWQEKVHNNAKEKGFWEGADPYSIEDIAMRAALLHTEVTEAFEEARNGRQFDDVYYMPNKPTKPEGMPIEIADVVIRCMDWCGGLGIDLEAMIKLKHDYNVTRPHMHGKKC